MDIGIKVPVRLSVKFNIAQQGDIVIDKPKEIKV